MEVSHGAGSGSGGDEGENQNRQSEDGRRFYNRHAPNQTSRLEQLFNIDPQPDEVQRQLIAQQLGMSPNQIKFWFQNRRTQQKSRTKREDNNALRAENERMKSEMIGLKETLKSSALLCQTCGGPVVMDVDRLHSMVQLQVENQRIKHELERAYKQLPWHNKEINSYPWPLSSSAGPELQLGPPSLENSYDALPNTALPLPITTTNTTSDENQGLVNYLGGGEIPEVPKSAKEKRAESHRAVMYEAVVGAKEELFRLLFTAERHLWVHSPTNSNTQVINPFNYHNMFPRATSHFSTPTARVESSKDSRIVNIRALQLVKMLMDQEMWGNVFSTMISKALTLEVVDKGLESNRDGALQLLYEEMHILSPLVPPREFFILRYCQKVEENGWIIGDVSFDDYDKKGTTTATTSTLVGDALRAWKRPSGLFIQALPDGTSRVTWVEHVEVDDETLLPRLYRDVIRSGVGYGAQRWLMELQRMTQKFNCISSSPLFTTIDFNIPPSAAAPTAMTMLPEGRKNLMRIAQRMVSSFCGSLNVSSKLEDPRKASVPSEEEGINGNNIMSGSIRVSVRENSERSNGHPIGTIAVAAISLWLPLPSQQLFNFFRDATNRIQWDALTGGQPMHEVASFSTAGTHLGNSVSVLRSKKSDGGNPGLIIQESFTNPYGSYIVFTPLSVADFTAGIDGRGTRTVALLPSGITISEDGKHYYSSSSSSNNGASSSSSSSSSSGARGSILTLSYQLLVDSNSNNAANDDDDHGYGYGGVKIESVDAANSLLATVVEHIKVALNCPLVEFN